MMHANERSYPYLVAVGHLIDAVQRIHRTKPGTSPLSLDQIHFWLQQITVEDLNRAGPARQRERELREQNQRERSAAEEENPAAQKEAQEPPKDRRNLFLVA
jgi:hypothetical protein